MAAEKIFHSTGNHVDFLCESPGVDDMGGVAPGRVRRTSLRPSPSSNRVADDGNDARPPRFFDAAWPRLFLNRPIGAALALLAFAVLTRMRDFGNPVAHVDEQYYLLVGDRILHGARLYIDLWDRKPPGCSCCSPDSACCPVTGSWPIS